MTGGIKKVQSQYQYLVPSAFPKDGTKKVSYRDVWEGFKEYTTAHGVPHLDRAKGKFIGYLMLYCDYVNIGHEFDSVIPLSDANPSSYLVSPT